MDCSWQRCSTVTAWLLLQQLCAEDAAIIQEQGVAATSTEHTSAPTTSRRAKNAFPWYQDVKNRSIFVTFSLTKPASYLAGLAISSCNFASSRDACAALRAASAKNLQCSAVCPDMGCLVA